MAPKGSAESPKALELTSGFSYPSKRDESSNKSPGQWLKGYANDTGVPQYWRVHDKFYDLKEFVDKHPGGRFWIQSTKGSDITELFESYHVTKKPELLLQKYFVRDAKTVRKSPFTFRDDGFFRTFKRKVMKRMEGVVNEPTLYMRFIQDGLFFGFIFTFLLFGYWQSHLGMILSGILLTLATIAAHNFFHQRDNWRMYIFDFGVLSSSEWRISHGISHHMFPNTIYDLEISVLEPLIQLLPVYNFYTGWWLKYIAYMIFPIYFMTPYFLNLYKTIFGIIPRRWTYTILPSQYFLLCAITGSFQQALGLFLTLHCTYGYVFVYIGVTAAHHSHQCYMEGDKIISDKDWGLYQIAATCDRKIVMKSLFLSAVTFGHHTLHHLFPAVDQSILPLLHEDFQDTCDEFGIELQFMTVWEGFIGFFNRSTNTKVTTEIQTKFRTLKKEK